MNDPIPIKMVLDRISRAALDGLVTEETIHGNSNHRLFSTEITMGDGTSLTLTVSFRGTIENLAAVRVQIFNDSFVYDKPMDMGSYIGLPNAEYPNLPVRLSKPTAAREVHKLLRENFYPATLRIKDGGDAEDVEATLVRFVLENSHELA